MVLATVTDAAAISAVQAGVGLNGTLLVLAGLPSLTISSLPMFGRQAIRGWYSGTAIDSEDTMAFSAMTGAVIGMSHEGPKAERKEAQQERQETQKDSTGAKTGH